MNQQWNGRNWGGALCVAPLTKVCIPTQERGNEEKSAQPKLGEQFRQKLENGWKQSNIVTRTERAICHMAEFIPAYSSAEVGGKPLFGAQQIPGDDPTLSAANGIIRQLRNEGCWPITVTTLPCRWSSASLLLQALTRLKLLPGRATDR